jgi:CRP/FNR family cyclic AMP-dependent transcriptional regulator
VQVYLHDWFFGTFTDRDFFPIELIFRLAGRGFQFRHKAGHGCLFGFRNKHTIVIVFRRCRVHNFHIGVSRAERCMSSGKARSFDPKAFLAQAGLGKTILQYPKNKAIFAQGDPSDAVFYIQDGRARLTVLSSRGKEATIALLREGDFVGEACITSDQPLRVASATAITDCRVLRIEKSAMLDVLHREHAFSDLFVAYLVDRYNQTQADLVDQLFNSAEKRLARTLLLLARFGKEGRSENVIPRISQETLAEMVGTTRARVNFFMNRFRQLGLIHYNGGLEVHSSLLDVVLHD